MRALTPGFRYILFVAALLTGIAHQPRASAQLAGDDEILLPDSINNNDIEMHGRFRRNWRQADGTHIILYSGGFRLTSGKRVLSANNAVVWARQQKSEEGRRYYDLTVYLSERAEVREPAGTTTEDSVLLISNLRTYGQVITQQDAHSAEPAEDNELFQRATRDRARIEGDEPEPETPTRDLAVRSPSTAARRITSPRRVTVSVKGRIEPAQTADGETVQVVTGGIFASQTGGPDAPVLEIQAENAVLFLADRAASTLARQLSGDSAAATADEPAQSSESAEKSSGGKSGAIPLGQSLGDVAKAVYLEGDVLLVFGERVVRANRIFYDFERDRALILDAVFHQEVPNRRIPLYIRASEVRQLSAREYSASGAKVTTSEFFTPSYHMGAEKIVLRDTTVRDTGGKSAGALAGNYELRNATLNVENVPIAFWPYSKGALEQSETLIRRIATGYSDDYGFRVETAWYLFNLLGITPPPGADATLKLDYYTKRGPGIGVDGSYQQQDYFGYTRNYLIHDEGEDNFGPFRDNTPDSETRGRTLWRHRHYLPNDWELSLEIAYASDPGFLEEYERSEWFEQKDQETAIYLKRAKEVDAITLLANWRLLDFVTQTEHLPELTYRRLGDVLGPIVTYHESRVGGVRYRTDDRHFFDTKRFSNDGLTDLTFRGDARQEAELPLKLDGLNIVPFGSVRGSYWDGQPLASGGLWRGLGVYGVRGGGWLSKVYDDAKSELLDIDRVRHVIQPVFAAWGANSNTRSDNITPFDEGIEAIDAVYGAMVGVRNTWQTKRGAADQRRTVDLLSLYLEAGAFGGDIPENERSNGYANPLRPEASRPRNYAAAELWYRVSDTTTLAYDVNWDMNDSELDRHNVSLAIERNPRLSYVFGYRHAGDIDLDLVGGGFNYRLNEKHIFAARTWFDTDRGRLGELTLSLVRKLPRWYVSINVEFDEVFDDTSISVSVWPEGIPEWTLGSRRFSQLGDSTAIRPDSASRSGK